MQTDRILEFLSDDGATGSDTDASRHCDINVCHLFDCNGEATGEIYSAPCLIVDVENSFQRASLERGQVVEVHNMQIELFPIRGYEIRQMIAVVRCRKEDGKLVIHTRWMETVPISRISAQKLAIREALSESEVAARALHADARLVTRARSYAKKLL